MPLNLVTTGNLYLRRFFSPRRNTRLAAHLSRSGWSFWRPWSGSLWPRRHAHAPGPHGSGLTAGMGHAEYSMGILWYVTGYGNQIGTGWSRDDHGLIGFLRRSFQWVGWIRWKPSCFFRCEGFLHIITSFDLHWFTTTCWHSYSVQNSFEKCLNSKKEVGIAVNGF